MAKWNVKVLEHVCTCYEVEADNEEQALQRYEHGEHLAGDPETVESETFVVPSNEF